MPGKYLKFSTSLFMIETQTKKKPWEMAVRLWDYRSESLPQRGWRVRTRPLEQLLGCKAVKPLGKGYTNLIKKAKRTGSELAILSLFRETKKSSRSTGVQGRQ